MKRVMVQICTLVVMITAGQLAALHTYEEDPMRNEGNAEVFNLDPTFPELGTRFKRQTSTTTTARPKKNRPTNIFSLVSVLVSETREDANRAFNEIGTLFNSQFSESNATTPKESTMGTDDPSSSPSEGDEDNEVTTTTEPYRISRNEFLGILRSNVQGLVRLFGKEFRVAIKDSNQNAKEFGRDLGTALRPLLN